MIAVQFEPTINNWRAKARMLLAAEAKPEDVLWSEHGTLFDASMPAVDHGQPARVPRAFLEAAELVALHSDSRRWALLYRVLYRLTHGEPALLEVVTDDDIRQMENMRKQVAHDIHRMHAFVRFREVDGVFVAWYEPDHNIVEAAAPWFRQRFAAMRWNILTPLRCAHWDGAELSFSEGVPRSAAPSGDLLEDLWRAYYASTFNPARTNVDLLRSHMPQRKWRNLPEAAAIPDLVREAASRASRMVSAQSGSTAAAFIPINGTLPVLREAVAHCRGCELWEHATQPVFGEGPANARIAMIGEQPGDNEDREGRPFIGPAGQLFDRALADAGLSRSEIYLSGAVKHFRYEERGKRRIHKTASKAHVAACQPWLEAELSIVKPKLIVCMGNTAALSVIGRGVRLLEERGRILPHRGGGSAMVTVHPGFLLRIPDETRKAQEYARFVDDLRSAQQFANAA